MFAFFYAMRLGLSQEGGKCHLCSSYLACNLKSQNLNNQLSELESEKDTITQQLMFLLDISEFFLQL